MCHINRRKTRAPKRDKKKINRNVQKIPGTFNSESYRYAKRIMIIF